MSKPIKNINLSLVQVKCVFIEQLEPTHPNHYNKINLDHQGRQISPSGVVLETISPDGVVSKIIAAWGSFLRACKSQTAIGNGDLVSVSNPPHPVAI